MTKIAVLNNIEIIDWSCAFGECEYVLAENSEENRSKLLTAGFTEEQLQEASDDDGEEIDMAYLAFNFTSAKWWSAKLGFGVEEYSGQGGTGDE